MRSGAAANLDDFIPRFDFAFLKDTEIETGPAALDQQRRHSRLVHSDAHAIASDARLRHFEQRAANSVAVAYAHLTCQAALRR